MARHTTRLVALLCCMIAVLYPVVPTAQTAAAAQVAIAAAPATAADPVPAADPALAPPFGAAAIDDGALGAIAGREDINQISLANSTAGVSRTSVGDNVTTGDARISDNAFQNLSGLSILNVNTGNNVAINATMNVNIAIQPGQ
ncbi:hypothetical protein ACT009_13815 [Sphingomonas sp. Tas61C01]|uniref:hypothetical protein n=1 Tax=Sphingomonas sp. Tas61C01 TaxID=3458297 RepID=UPI00403E7DB5